MRLGEHVAKDMIAVRIGPDMRMAVVGAPAYFAKRPRPQTPQDLTAHDCINLRLPTHGGLYAWEFEKDGRELRVRVEGQFVFNNAALMLNAALDGLGLAYLPEEQVRMHLADGRLVRVLADWCPPFSGYHLYYPSRRQPRRPSPCWSRRCATDPRHTHEFAGVSGRRLSEKLDRYCASAQHDQRAGEEHGRSPAPPATSPSAGLASPSARSRKAV